MLGPYWVPLIVGNSHMISHLATQDSPAPQPEIEKLPNTPFGQHAVGSRAAVAMKPA